MCRYTGESDFLACTYALIQRRLRRPRQEQQHQHPDSTPGRLGSRAAPYDRRGRGASPGFTPSRPGRPSGRRAARRSGWPSVSAGARRYTGQGAAQGGEQHGGPTISRGRAAAPKTPIAIPVYDPSPLASKPRPGRGPPRNAWPASRARPKFRGWASAAGPVVAAVARARAEVQARRLAILVGLRSRAGKSGKCKGARARSDRALSVPPAHRGGRRWTGGAASGRGAEREPALRAGVWSGESSSPRRSGGRLSPGGTELGTHRCDPVSRGRSSARGRWSEGRRWRPGRLPKSSGERRRRWLPCSSFSDPERFTRSRCSRFRRRRGRKVVGQEESFCSGVGGQLAANRGCCRHSGARVCNARFRRRCSGLAGRTLAGPFSLRLLPLT